MEVVEAADVVEDEAEVEEAEVVDTEEVVEATAALAPTAMVEVEVEEVTVVRGGKNRFEHLTFSTDSPHGHRLHFGFHHIHCLLARLSLYIPLSFRFHSQSGRLLADRCI